MFRGPRCFSFETAGSRTNLFFDAFSRRHGPGQAPATAVRTEAKRPPEPRCAAPVRVAASEVPTCPQSHPTRCQRRVVRALVRADGYTTLRVGLSLAL